MNASLDPTTEHQLERHDRRPLLRVRQIEDVMNDSAEQILKTAKVLDFVPLMAYRITRERLNAISRTQGQDTQGSWDVVFVSLSGGGRGQFAAALTTLLSERQISVHSAGTPAQGQIDPGVRTLIAELGVNPDEAFARPVTDEVLRAADVIVTMGHSVGVIDIPPQTRHEDWRVGDPNGAPIGEIRGVRADIEHRVRALLADLGIPTADGKKRTPRLAAS